jgi:hypothetical protein
MVSEAIKYLNVIPYFEPSPSLYGRITYTHLKENSILVNLHTYAILKSKGKTCMVEEPSYVKQLSLNHVCKIWLKMFNFVAPAS